MSQHIHDVVQIGLGPVGLTMAALVGQSGHTVAVCEKQHDLYGLPRAGHIDHEIVRILGTPGISGWNSDYMQYQPILESALSERIAADPRVEVMMGWQAVDFVEHDDHVEVVVARTAVVPGEPRPVVTGEQRVLRGRYVIAADGANSGVRRFLGIERDDLGFNERWLDVDARKKRELRFDFDCGQRCDPARPTTILPLGKRHRRWEWALLPGESVQEFERPETAWRLLGELGVGPDDVEIVRQIVYTFEARTAVEWQRGRFFLIGDAAHTMPPFMGQGMCSGMRDAKNLAWKLDLVLRGLAPEALLATYEQERRPHAHDWTVISLEAGKVPCTTDPEAARERDARFAAGWRPPLPDFPQLVGGVLHRDVAGGPVAPAGELGLQARVERAGRVELFDDAFGAGARWQVISPRCDPRTLLEDADREFLEGLGAVFAHVGPGGDAEDADGAYATYFAQRRIAVVVNRPDFYVFGAARAPQDLAQLVGALRAHVTRERLALPS
jgi:2-polyprenyl-6-methoxyphenol hydroxylase-like FAD-dependent oxidoreductase